MSDKKKPIGFTEEKLEKMSKELKKKARESAKTWKKIERQHTNNK